MLNQYRILLSVYVLLLSLFATVNLLATQTYQVINIHSSHHENHVSNGRRLRNGHLIWVVIEAGIIVVLEHDDVDLRVVHDMPVERVDIVSVNGHLDVADLSLRFVHGVLGERVDVIGGDVILM